MSESVAQKGGHLITPIIYFLSISFIYLLILISGFLGVDSDGVERVEVGLHGQRPASRGSHDVEDAA